MTSKEADEARRKERDRILAMSPGDRIKLALEIGEQAVGEHMRKFGVDRAQAVRAIKLESQAGRRRSVANVDFDETEPSDR